MKLALGRVKECPFKPADVKALKDEVIMNLASMGIDLERSSGDRDDVPIDFRFLDLLLRAAEDPEVGIGDFAKGVRVGPGVRMPRLPALYKRKKKWRLASQADLRNYLEDEEAGGEHTWRRNYSSLDELSDKVIDVLEDQSKRGQILKLSEAEAKRQYPNLVVASLGANKKDKPSGEVTARVLFDGTHGLSVNTRTRIRDQERSPVASDLKRAMREKAALNEPTFALTADVSEAHRQIPIHKCDWHLLGCQVQAGGDVYINTVGTFGVASASYYWSRVSGALGRLTQYLAGNRARTWHMVVADDYHLESGGQGYRAALVVFLVLCSSIGVPLSWAKTAGGDTVTWVGFELLHQSRHLGVSQRRAEWFVKWARELAAAETVHMSRFEEGLGRIMYVVGALELERPFLGPLYRFMSLHPRISVRKVRGYVRFFLRYLADQVAETRHYYCAVELHASTLAPRVDAQANSIRTGIGGWFPAVNSEGKIDPSISRWFSLEIRQEEWPWVYAKRQTPALVIVTLEALAVLVALK